MLTKLNRLLAIAAALGIWINFKFSPGGVIDITAMAGANSTPTLLGADTSLETALDIALVEAIRRANIAVSRADIKIDDIETEKETLVALLGDDLDVIPVQE